MRDFIDSRQITSKLECPGCDSELELSTLINHGSDGVHVDNYIRSTVERIVFTLNEYKWCPSPSCGKVLKVDIYSNPFGTVSCTCGFKMCLKCNNAPHFPAKCSQIANYYEKLKTKNDFVDPNDQIVYIKGKRCPKCNTFVEKNGGCNHMICSLCGENFCWKCLECLGKAFYNHSDCKYTADSITVEFKKKMSKNQNSASNYEYSLIYRKKRSTAYQRVLRNNVNDFLSRLRNSELESYHDSNNYVTDVSIVLEKRSELREFLNKMIKFLNELYFICEHSYVLLNDKTLEKEKVDRIKRIVRSFELLIWRIELIFESETTNLKLFDKLRELYNKGLNLIGLFRNIKLE
jgi:ariadne-1